MPYLTSGLFFIFFNFEIRTNSFALGLLPDFVGYLLLIRGLRLLPGEWEVFYPPVRCAKVLAAVSAVLYVLRLVFLVGESVFTSVLVGIFHAAAPLLQLWLMLRALEEFEHGLDFSFGAQALRKNYFTLAAVTWITFICSFFPVISVLGTIALLCTQIWFLVRLYNAQKVYRDKNSPFA